MAESYGFESIPDIDALRDAGTWRPYTSWVRVLFRTALEDQTREIAGAERPLRITTDGKVAV